MNDHQGSVDSSRDELLENLRIHQVELEAQNAQLRDAEATARRSQQRFQQLFQDAPIPYLDLDSAGIVLNHNRALRDLLGINDVEIVGHPFVVYVRPEYHAAFFRLLKTGISTGTEARGTVELVVPNGAVREVVLVSSAGVNDDGVQHTITAVLDQTAILAYQNELSVKTERYEHLLDHITDAVYLSEFSGTSGTGQFVEVNAAALAMLGYARDELLSKGLIDIVCVHSRNRLDDIFRELIRKRSLTLETEHIARDGRSIPVEVNSVIVTIGGKQYILSVARDVTDRRADRRRVERLKDLLDSLRKANQNMLYLEDIDELADTICRILVESRGYDHAWILLDNSVSDSSDGEGRSYRSFHQFGLDDGAKAFTALLEHHKFPGCIARATSEDSLIALDASDPICTGCPARPTYQQGLSLIHSLARSGEHLGVIAVALTERERDDDEERGLLIQLANDLSFTLWALRERRRRNEASARIASLLEEQRLLGRELRHRAKNDFGIIRSLLSLQAAQADDERVSSALYEAAGRLEAMVRIQDALLDRDSEHGWKPDVLVQAVADARGGNNGTGSITVESEGIPVLVSGGQASHLGIVVNELLTNAHKYGSQPVVVRLRSESSWLHIEVEDGGPGFPETVLRQGRYGFGLSMVKSLVEIDGGEFLLRNTPDNHGCVRVTVRTEPSA